MSTAQNVINANSTSPLSPNQGGTGVANGSATLTLGGNVTHTGAFTTTLTTTATTTLTLPTTGTLATTSQLPSSGTPLALNSGGTAANLTASNGGIFYSTASAGAILAGTATAGQLLTSGASTTPAWTTSTYPATNAINTLLYASSANVMAALATANNGVLITSGAGAPSISSTLPSAVQGNITTVGTIGTGTWQGTQIGVTYGGTGLTGTTANQLLYSSATNTVAGLATANSSVLITSGAGVPSLSTTLPASLTIPTATVTGEFTGTINSSGGTAWQLLDAAGGTANQGAFYFSRNSSSVGSITTTNVATLYNTTSDARLKNNVKPLVSTGVIIDSLNPVTYEWNHIKENTHGVGFIAQEVYQVVPEAVVVGDNDPLKRPGDKGYQQWGGDWARMIPYMVAELKYLRLRVAHLENKEKNDIIQ